MGQLNRREFVIATTAVCGCALCGSAATEALAQKGGAPIDIGTPADYSGDGISDKFLRSQRVLIVRSGKRLHAMTAVCTHRSCVVRLRDAKIKCPCHGSSFSEHGTPTGGPAKSSLVRYGINLSEGGKILVDKSKQFPERQWEEEGSFIELS
jgi:Rieske Fe-S protein